MQTPSYCLKAGTHGPGEGDGYLYAPPKGPAEDTVMTIVRNSVNRPEIPPQQIQQLLRANIARVELWVQQGSPAVGKEYDPATHIAVPGNTARQRLIQSGRSQAAQ